MTSISTGKIIKAVSVATGVRQRDILGPRRSSSLVTARHVAMYLARTLTDWSYPELGLAFGNRHHTTVMSAVASIEVRRSKDMRINALIARISDSLGVTLCEEETVPREALTNFVARTMHLTDDAGARGE